MDTVLVVDDDKIIRHSLKENLEGEGYLVIEAANGARMMDIIDHHTIDLILLDLHLRDELGTELIKPLRSHTNAPLIIVSGDNTASKKIRCLKDGADDYIKKPFDLQEISARIYANIRRYKTSLERPASHAENDVYYFNGLTLDPAKYQLFDGNNQSRDLTPREFILLETLIKNKGTAMPREALCDALREERYVPSPRSIDIKITRLRKKIRGKEADQDTIQTVRGIGYMFIEHT